MKKSRLLKEAIAAGNPVQAPGAYDVIGATLIQRAGFPAMYVTGSGVSLTLLGHPDLNTVSYAELYQLVHNMVNAVDIPVIVDIDTGFGGPLNLIRLVKDFERLDVAAVQIEDQLAPKRCGHELGRKVVSVDEMKNRIQTILDCRAPEDGLLIIARTDARTEHGLEEAIRRGNAYLKAGADIIFVESPESVEEVKQIVAEIPGPVLFNNVEGGRSPFLSRDVLQSCGVAVTIYPNAITRINVQCGMRMLDALKNEGTTEKHWGNMVTHKDLFAFFSHDEWVAKEKQYL